MQNKVDTEKITENMRTDPTEELGNLSLGNC